MVAEVIDIPRLQNKLFKTMSVMPTTFRDRSEKARYEVIIQDYEDFLKAHSEEIIDALTDAVKDFITPSEVSGVNDKLKTIFESELGKRLFQKLKSVEHSLKPADKNSVIKKRLSDLKGEISASRYTLLAKRWKDPKEAETFTLFSQVLYLSEGIIERILSDIDWGNNEGGEEANMLIGVSLYLILKFIAMLKEKVTMDSLTYAVSAVQVFLEEWEIAPFT
jgi:hypothetical protein